jgi:ABC transport system ATP-binding/permease protein
MEQSAGSQPYDVCPECGGLIAADQSCTQCSNNGEDDLRNQDVEESAGSENGHTVQNWLIGGNAGNDLVVDLPTVSGRHCRLTKRGQDFLLEDLGSTNGTYVNGTRINSITAISPNDKITLGQSVPMPWPASELRKQPQIVRVGRAPDNDVVLDYPMVSAHHARIVVDQDGARIEDLGSTNGTAVGSLDQKIEHAQLTPGEAVYFGTLRVEAGRLLGGRLSLGNHTHMLMSLTQQVTILGREPGCDDVLDDPRVSRRHARLTRSPEGLTIEDLDSANGTFVNGVRISTAMPLQAGDQVTIGRFSFLVGAQGQLERQDRRGNVSVQARAVTVSVGTRCLLEDVSLTVYPGELVGLMGPSGAGKTTLLNALNGYALPTSGKVFFNGQDLYANYDQFRGLIGYVPQDDIIHEQLTVAQALYFSARLRLPADTSDAEIQVRVQRVISQLALGGAEQVLIGSPNGRGISGGQRKRVNLAMELLTEPAVLFLDEPTSGLSSEDTMNVMRLLRRFADEGRTIVLTIHQPGLEAYRLLDNLILMGRDAGSVEPGRLVYYGPAYPQAAEFFQPDPPDSEQAPSPDDVLRGLARLPCSVWQQRYEASRWKQQYVVDRAAGQASSPDHQIDAGPVTETPFDPLQWWTLVRRTLAVKARDTTNTATLIAQAPIIGLLIAGVFGARAAEEATPENWTAVANAVATTIFLTALAALWFGCSNAAREIVGEWPIYRRERMVTLTIPSFMAAKLTVLGGLCLLQCLILLGIVAMGAGLQSSLPAMFALLALVSLVGVSIGLLVSAVAKTSEVAIAILPLVLLPMVILAGVLHPLHEMNRGVSMLAQMMPSRWAFEGMLILESEKRPVLSLGGLPGQEDVAVESDGQQDMAEHFFPAETDRMGVVASCLALLLTFGLVVGGVYACLRLRDVRWRDRKLPADRFQSL